MATGAMLMVDLLFSPLSWLLLAILAGVPAWRARSRRQWPWRGCIALAGIALAMMTPLVANALVGWLERPQPGAASCALEPPGTIVVLAGGLDHRPRDGADFSALDSASRRRMDRGIDYWRSSDGGSLLLAGGALRQGLPAHASLMAAYARWHGVPPAAIRLEARSRTTWQNARYLALMAAPHRIALTTSAMHMPRARFAFAAAGFQACPLPADFRNVPVALPSALVPRSSALQKTEEALHELAGLGYYHWLRWVEARR